MIASTRVPKLIAALEQAGCAASRRAWALAGDLPRDRGRSGLLELRQTPEGITIGCEKDPA